MAEELAKNDGNATQQEPAFLGAISSAPSVRSFFFFFFLGGGGGGAPLTTFITSPYAFFVIIIIMYVFLICHEL